MELQLQVTGRNVEVTTALEDSIRREVDKLEKFYPRIMGCRVLVEAEHRYPTGSPVAYAVRIDLTVPQGELPTTRQTGDVPWTAVQRAFDAARRQLEDYARVQRGDIGVREDPRVRGRVARLFPWEGYGFLEADDGHEVYFHRNSVLQDGFDRLEVGQEVTFVETAGDRGPQASTVTPGSRRAVREEPAS